MSTNEGPIPAGEAEHDQDTTSWDDIVFTEPEPPPDWNPEILSFDDTSVPPQLLRTVNCLPLPEHDLASDDAQGIADFILSRAREGVDDIFAHDDYSQSSSDDDTEAWARAIAEHQTGIPYTQPAYFYSGGQKAVAAAIAKEGRYPLAGQCQQSVTTALCIGGWDGGPYGDIGSGIGSQPMCARLGKGWKPEDLKDRSTPGKTGLVLADWQDDLWNEIGVGTCLFWSAPCPFTKDGQTCGGGKHVVGCGQGSGHVAVVIRKHPTERRWQLWDTTTSFTDPASHPGAAKGARMLWESHWWGYIPQIMQGGTWHFRGLGTIEGIGATVRDSLTPRGRCRLILRRRKDGGLLYRSAWLSMEEEGLPISWLLRSVRGVPHCDAIEATWCIDSPGDGAQKRATPLLDCTCDAKGNAKMSWQPQQGSHKRPMSAAVWSAADAYSAASEASSSAEDAASPSPTDEAAPDEAASDEAASDAVLKNAPLAGQPELERAASGKGSIRKGMKGDGVKALQEALIALGIEVRGGADGAFGPGLESAVKALQTKLGVGADGVVGPGTLKAIDAKLGGLAAT